jgi:hypothetical protein
VVCRQCLRDADARILDVRAYFTGDLESDVEFPTFPYAERGYRTLSA